MKVFLVSSLDGTSHLISMDIIIGTITLVNERVAKGQSSALLLLTSSGSTHCLHLENTVI